MRKDSRLIEIFENTIPHGSFLSQSSIESCMHQSYMLGVQDVITWLESQKHLSDNINYIIEEYKNQADL
jgi:hypothetical protein